MIFSMGQDIETRFEQTREADGAYFQSRPWRKVRRFSFGGAIILILLLIFLIPLLFQRIVPIEILILTIVPFVGVTLSYFVRRRRGSLAKPKAGTFFKLYRDHVTFMPEDRAIPFPDIEEIVISGLLPDWNLYHVSVRPAVINFYLRNGEVISYTWDPQTPFIPAEQKAKEIQIDNFLMSLGFNVTKRHYFPYPYTIRLSYAEKT